MGQTCMGMGQASGQGIATGLQSYQTTHAEMHRHCIHAADVRLVHPTEMQSDDRYMPTLDCFQASQTQQKKSPD